MIERKASEISVEIDGVEFTKNGELTESERRARALEFLQWAYDENYIPPTLRTGESTSQ